MAKSNTNTIGSRIQVLRKNKGETQADLAKCLNVKRETVNQWENNERDLKTQYTISLADHFSVTCDEILRGVKSENVDINTKTGLSDEAVKTLCKLKELGDTWYHLKYSTDFVNVFLSAKGIDYIFRYIDDYIESVKYCAFLERSNKDIDFSSNGVIRIGGNTQDDENKNEILSDYHETKKEQRYKLFDIQQGFIDFINAYAKCIEDAFAEKEYLDDCDKKDTSRENMLRGLKEVRSSLEEHATALKELAEMEDMHNGKYKKD